MHNRTGASALSLKNKAKSRPKLQQQKTKHCLKTKDLNGT